MYEKILLPIDLHDSSSWEDAIPVAVRQCEANDAALHILYVMSKVHPSVAAFMADDIDEETRQQEAERQLAEFASKIGDQGAEVTYQVASGDSIYDEVLKCRERIGADLIVHGETPYGNFPSDCGQCDTYGPLNYLAYVPFEAVMPHTGKWDDLPAAHGAAVLFDGLTLLALLVLGWRLAGRRMGLTFAIAWAAFPFTAFTLSSNSNDALIAACVAWGLVLAARPLGRGAMIGLGVAAKIAPAILVPLWARHPFPRRDPATGPRRLLAYLSGLVLAALLTGWVLFLDGTDGIRAFWSRTVAYQADRESPFSIWGQYDGLRPVHVAVGVLVVLAALLVLRWPRRLDIVQWAAISAALLIGFELVLTHWFYLYIPWFLPLVILVVVPEWPEPDAQPNPPDGRLMAAARRMVRRGSTPEVPAGGDA